MILQVTLLNLNICQSLNNVCLVAPGDYGAVINETIEFQTGDSSAEHTITINDDDICENETFFSSIVAVATGVVVDQSLAQVIIDDSDDCSKSFFF